MHLGAVVLLPRGYDDRPHLRYPMVIEADHFTLEPAFGFTTEPPSDEPGLFDWLWDAAGGMRESGYDFQRAWTGDDFPRVIAVRLQHPTPFFDDSYGLNSANNGPYGDAIHQELIPHLERTFRMIGEPYARVLTGGSTGGWMSLAWQVHYPTFYGGTWTFYPDSVDFRRYQLIDIYADANAFLVPNAVPGAPERMFQRTTEGQPVGSVRQLSRLERAQGSRGRSGGQLDAWNAAWGPVGADGYPRRLWDLETGVIDREVAFYMRDNGYDLRHYLAGNWSRIGPDLVGKIRLYNPEMDQFYLSYAVYLLEEFLARHDRSALRRRGGPRPSPEGPRLVAVPQRGARAAHGGAHRRQRPGRRGERLVRGPLTCDPRCGARRPGQRPGAPGPGDSRNDRRANRLGAPLPPRPRRGPSRLRALLPLPRRRGRTRRRRTRGRGLQRGERLLRARAVRRVLARLGAALERRRPARGGRRRGGAGRGGPAAGEAVRPLPAGAVRSRRAGPADQRALHARRPAARPFGADALTP